MSKPVLVRFIGDAANLTGTVHKVGGTMGGLKSTLLGLGIGALLFGEAKRATQGWQDHLVVQHDTENQIRASGNAAHVTAKQVGELSDAIEAKTGKDGDAIQSGANMLLTFHGIRNEVGAGNDIFNQSVSVLTDMTAKMNGGKVTQEGMANQAKQLGIALNDPEKGMTRLTRAGVVFNDQQRAQIKALSDSGDKLGAQKIILRELSTEFGGTARATSTSTDMMMVKVHQLEDGLGSKLLPIVNAGAGIFAKHSGAVLGTAAAIGVMVGVVKVMALVEQITTKGTIANTIATKLAAAASKAWAAAQWLLNAALDANPIALVVIGIAALIAVIILAYKHSQTFRNIVQAAFHGAQAAAGDLVGSAVKGFRFLLGIWLDVAGGILHGAAVAFGWVPGIGGKLKAADRAFQTLKTSILAKLQDVADSAYGWGERVGSNYAAGVRVKIPQIGQAGHAAALALTRAMRAGSPAKEGPLHDTPPEEMGRHIGELWAQGLRGAFGSVRGASGLLAGAALPGSGRLAFASGSGMNITVNARTNADAAEIAREVAWQMRTSGR